MDAAAAAAAAGEAGASGAASGAGGGGNGGGGDSSSGDGSGGDDDDDDSNSDGAPSRPPQDRGRAGMTREEQRLHKIAVKLAKRERRKTKTPKAVKKAHAKAR